VEQALAEFAATLVSPLAGVAVLVLAFSLRRPWRVRGGSAAVGLLMALPGVVVSAHPLPAALLLAPAAVAACLLQAELCLAFLLPACELAVALAVHLVLRLRLLLRRLAAGMAERDR
jgi:hypothetical protein